MKKLLWIAGGATLIYFCLAMLIAVIPAINLSGTPPGPGVEPLTPLQAEGRDVYVANGCSYCHTQQVRPLEQDMVFGRPSAPGDFAYQTPELLGSERTGPDLTNVGNTKPSDVWQYIHLYDPRAVMPQSIMPNFKFLFQVVATVPAGETAVPIPAKFAPPNGNVIPTQKAKALVAYLLSLKQQPLAGAGIAGNAAGAPAPAPAKNVLAAATGGYAYDAASGKTKFEANCAACHQATGEGVPGAFPPLKGNAAVDNADPTLHIRTILHGAHGVTVGGIKYSSAMPPFADQLSDTDIADIANYERSSWSNDAKPVTPSEVAAIRANKSLGAGSSAPAASSSAPAPSAPAASASASSAPGGGYDYDAAKGKALFTANCSACHQATGEGIPGAFPPLKGNAAVDNPDPTLHIHTVLHGAQGTTIGGVKYTSAMPPFAQQLNDADIANIINYERSSWGNHAQHVTPADVARARSKRK